MGEVASGHIGDYIDIDQAAALWGIKVRSARNAVDRLGIRKFRNPLDARRFLILRSDAERVLTNPEPIEEEDER